MFAIVPASYVSGNFLAYDSASNRLVDTGASLYAAPVNTAPDTGSADAYAAAFSPALMTPTPGTIIHVGCQHANATTAPTLDAGSGAKTIVRQGGGAVTANSILAGGWYTFAWDGDHWQITNPSN